MIIRMNIDNDNIMELSTSKKIDNIRNVYIAIGVLHNSNCTNCSKAYLYNGKCYERCPINTYPYFRDSNVNGYCLGCSNKVYEELNN